MIAEHQERKALVAGAELSLVGAAVAPEPLTQAYCGASEKVAAEFADKVADYPCSFVPLTPPEVAIYVATALAQWAGAERYAFATRLDGTIIGSTSYFPFFWSWPEHSPYGERSAPDAVEIGATWIAPSMQRTRCNTEAKLLLTRAFEAWQVHRVTLRADERQSALAQCDRTDRRDVRRNSARRDAGRDATPRNSAYYSISERMARGKSRKTLRERYERR